MIVKLLRVILIILFALGANAAALAGPQLVIMNGKLYGADSIQVKGALYDVRFQDGSCIKVFGTCEPASFTFSDMFSAAAAAQALQSYVFTDGVLGLFDSYPSLTNGCEHDIFCHIMTPYTINYPMAGTVTYALLDNRGIRTGPNGISLSGIDFAQSTDSEPRVWAVWSISAANSIPEPGTFWLFSLGGVLFGVCRLFRSKTGISR